MNNTTMMITVMNRKKMKMMKMMKMMKTLSILLFCWDLIGIFIPSSLIMDTITLR